MNFLKLFWPHFAFLIIWSAVLLIGLDRLGRERPYHRDSYKDTVTYVDTVRFYVPVSRDSVVIRYVTEKLPVADNTKRQSEDVECVGRDTVFVSKTDSADVEIPITQTVYEDSLYRAYVSGYHAQLDSIYVYGRREVVTVSTRYKRKKWGIGIQAGIGAGRNGVSPFIGVGVTRILWGF